LGLKWFAKGIARWQILCRLIVKRPRKPQLFIPTSVECEPKNRFERLISANFNGIPQLETLSQRVLFFFANLLCPTDSLGKTVAYAQNKTLKS